MINKTDALTKKGLSGKSQFALTTIFIKLNNLLII